MAVVVEKPCVSGAAGTGTSAQTTPPVKKRSKRAETTIIFRFFNIHLLKLIIYFSDFHIVASGN
jgi:hypothetical protein